MWLQVSAMSNHADEPMRVEVVYARPDRQYCIQLSLNPGATVRDALSAADARWPDVDLLVAAETGVGVFGEPRECDSKLADGDRVEVYRPLLTDPKTARLRRRDQQQAGQKTSDSR